MISTSQRWRKTALASLVAAAFGLYGSNASALALGRVTVQSALGDPLRAEIDIPEINADEASSLRPVVASPDAFRAAGLEYNPALAGVQISLQRRADGRAYLRLSSDRPVSEPFVDLILEASWASGRLVRDYTLLLDPPSLRAAPTPAPVAPQTSPVQITPPVASAPIAPRPAPAAPAASPAPRAPAAASPPAPRAPAPAAAPAAAAPAARAAPSAGGTTVVRPGDTAGQIARANKTPQVSLDQMLVALLRNNEGAFINGNLNRIKAGAVLNIPTEEQALSMGNAEARRTVVAHSRDFNEFRGKLAANAPNQQVAAADRSAGGSVQAQVQDNRSAASAPDKLTLSQGSVQAQQGSAAVVAQNRASQDAAQRAAEINKNLQDLGNLRAAAGAASGAAAAPPAAGASAPVAAASAPGVTIAAAPPPVVVASEPAATAAVTAPAPAAAPSAPAAVRPPVAVPAPAPVEEESFLASLMANPLLLGAGGALLVLLLALALYKARQRRNNADVDSAFLESRLQPDSFFGASGGQRVDTSEAAATGSSMVYSPSQLDAADDVDPVAEADVYLAYGRDIQAEEILREALRTHAGRIAIHQKLLDIYAKRRDAQAFEAMANEAYKLSGEGTPEWLRICEQGRSIDPENPLYQPGGQPSPRAASAAVGAAAAVAAMEATAPMGTAHMATLKMDAMPQAAPSAVDLDLDFSLDDFANEPSSIVEAQPTQMEPTVAIAPMEPSPPPALDLDFGLSTEPVAPAAASAQPSALELDLPDISKADDTLSLASRETDEFRHQAEVSFGSTSPIPLQMGNGGINGAADPIQPDVSFGYTAPGELTASQAPLHTPTAPDSGMLEFDLGTLSLELDPDPAAAPVPDAPAEPEDPLATKLALAEEFVSIGDDDGARALIEEVIAEASGDLKAKAQRALSALS